MKIILCDIQKPLVRAWEKYFKNITNVNVVCGDIWSVGPTEGLVSPSNSFGFLDGGIDYVYTKRFGWQLQEKLQAKIQSRPMGELVVGDALVIPTGDPDYPNLISAPTMRVPANVSNTVNAYLAFKAALIIARQYSFKSILCPGLGTSAGMMQPEVAAMQMYKAYADTVLFKTFPGDLRSAAIDHQLLGGDTHYAD